MDRNKLISFLLCLIFCSKLFSQEKEHWFFWSLLWTGSYTSSLKITEEDEFSAEELLAHGTLLNRGDLNIELPKQFLSLRFQVLDRRKIPPEEKYNPVFSPGFGFYYTGGKTKNYLGGARLLHGVLEEQGLPARLRNIWAKSSPFAENRKPVTIDLKNEVTAGREPETGIFLESPLYAINPGINLRSFVSGVFDNEFNPVFFGGIETQWNKNSSLRLDLLFVKHFLEEKKSSAWFSSSPPLPERDFRLWGFGAALNTKDFGFAFDGAYSETFAFGSDVYLSAGLRIGSKPWRFSFSADGSGPRFTDRAGNAAGEGLRLAGKLERQWIRSGFFRVNALLRSSLIDDGFDRANFSVYFRPSSPPPKEQTFFRFSRASLSFGRDARSNGKVNDSLDFNSGFNLGPLRSALSWNIHSQTGYEGNAGLLLMPLFFENMTSSKIAGELTWAMGYFNTSAKIGRTFRSGKEALWDFSLNTSFRPGRKGRIGLKIASPDFPEKWNWIISYRLQI